METLLGSCTKQQAPLSIDPDLVGTWHHDDNNNYLYFYSNGYCHTYDDIDQNNSYSKYSAENNTIAFQNADISGVWSYSISGGTLNMEENLTTTTPAAFTQWVGTYTKQ